jgi:hypothetical protein
MDAGEDEAAASGADFGGDGMNRNQRAVALLVVQAALVLSIAGKYLYERETCPRVWVRAWQYDPNMPLRGRYLALHLMLDDCGLPREQAVVQDGKLAPMPDRPDVTMRGNQRCDGTSSGIVDYFIADTANGPFPLKGDEELWVEVTIPPMGPPRPIQLALSKDGAFTPLNLR